MKTVVEVASPTCVPCKMLAGKLYAQAETSGKFSFYKVDAFDPKKNENVPELVYERLPEIKSTPHLFIFEEDGSCSMDQKVDLSMFSKILEKIL